MNPLEAYRFQWLKRFIERIWRAPTLLILLFCLFAFAGCENRKQIAFAGKTMGTTYHIKLVSGGGIEVVSLQKKIDQRLEQINDSMSTYRKESEISRFNAFSEVGIDFQISSDFMNVMTVGQNIYKWSAGAWDATIGPLVKLWGFYEARENGGVPDSDAIQAVLPKIGFHHIQLRAGNFLAKTSPHVTLDLASIAKGYGVDQIAALLRTEGIESALVEIGGEVFAYGLKIDGSPWTVGINTPRKDSPVDSVYKAVPLTNGALATSGDYRRFFEAAGTYFSHILDPRTGYPVNNRVVSVSVLAENCALADGLATAIMVMGPEKGLELVERLDGVDCLIVLHEGGNRLIDLYSSRFPKT